MLLFATHVALALMLFFAVNWVGEQASEFGYSSTTLFEDPKESLALNFLVRALSPAVFMVALSAIAVAAGYPDLRIGIYWIAINYYTFRFLYIILSNMQRLVSWPRFLFHSAAGLAAAWVAYQALVLPNRSLLPNLDTAGNELWLAIFAFLYAAANKVTTSGGPGHRGRNAFIKTNYENLERQYGDIISKRISDTNLQLIAYAILIYEDYCRPRPIRFLERLLFWKKNRTTGIMQFACSEPLTDLRSVQLGVDKLSSAGEAHADKGNFWCRSRATIRDYNMDENYINRVFEVMDILAKRGPPISWQPTRP
jgi:hypothetical protein